MKKQIKKLSLNKKTISNLNVMEMNNKIGGSTSCNYSPPHGKTVNGGNTCLGHNTCYNC